VAGDEVYGADPGLRAWLEARQVGYVLAVACDHRVRIGGEPCRVDALAAKVPPRAWQQVSCGSGAKGHRWYDWAFVRLDHGEADRGGQHGQRWLLIRRHQRTGELAFYRCFMPHPVPLAVLVGVARRRWRIEERSPDRQGPGRLGPASGAPLALLVPLGHVGDARPRLPGRDGIDRPGCRPPPDAGVPPPT
jgi:hypothetical protein